MVKQHNWQQSLIEVITDAEELCNILELDPIAFSNEYAMNAFALRVPRNFVARMEKGNLNDPLLKQVLPIKKESEWISGYTMDPLNEGNVNPLPGLLHKYHGRVLWMIAGSCAINCRYCFRRHFNYVENIPGKAGWEKILNYIRKDISLTEIIFSGGDPLLLKDDTLSSLIKEIASISHVQTLRIHTRLPIVIPERITTEFLKELTYTDLQVVMVLHANHPNEIDSSVSAGIQSLRRAGVTVLNQSVLLQGVNDQADTLVNLSRRLFKAGALPYYLHMLDAVQGAAHFLVSLDKARQLIKEISYQLPGYLVPRLVREEPGAAAKSLMS